MNEQTIIPEEPFRANFKQNAKGIWTVEFAVRAGDSAKINNRLDELNTSKVV